MKHPRFVAVLAVSALVALLAGVPAGAAPDTRTAVSTSAISPVLAPDSVLGAPAQSKVAAVRSAPVVARKAAPVAATKVATAAKRASVHKSAVVAPKAITSAIKPVQSTVDTAKAAVAGKQRAARIVPKPVTVSAGRVATDADLVKPVKFDLSVPAPGRVSINTPFATNQGFETGNLTGWSGWGPWSVTSGHSPYFVPSGIRMARGSSSGSCPGDPNVLYQNIYLEPGERLQGFAAFHFTDPGYADFARVTVFRPDSSSSVRFSSTGGSSSYETPMTSWSFFVTQSGFHTLVYEVGNGGDCAVGSHALFDARVTDLSLTTVFGAGSLSATLVDLGPPNVPLAGKTIHFFVLGLDITAVTNAQGVASITSLQNPLLLRQLYLCNCNFTAEFDGDSSYNGSFAFGKTGFWS